MWPLDSRTERPATAKDGEGGAKHGFRKPLTGGESRFDIMTCDISDGCSRTIGHGLLPTYYTKVSMYGVRTHGLGSFVEKVLWNE